MSRPQRSAGKSLVLIFLFLSFLFAAGFCLGNPDPNIARVEENLLPYSIIAGQPAMRLQDRMDHYGVPGVSIAIIEDFQIQWVAHYGVKAASSDRLVDGETRFNVGSLSKAMASACILSLVEQGLVDLNADVNPQLKSWQVPANEFTALAPVTPLLMMNHSAGFPRRPPYTYTAENMPTTMQMINGEPPSRSTPLRVFQKPGLGFQYSNGGFTVLQLLAEDVTGLSFDEAARRQVFVPLGLDHATFTTPLPESVLPAAASGHARNGGAISEVPIWMAHSAAGGLWITAEDYARFVVELQKSYHGKSNRIFSRELAREMLSPHAATIYGLGVFLYEGNGSEPFFSHIGDGPGFVAGFTAHRTEGYGAVILTNGAGGINLCREVLRSAARVYEWPGYLSPEREDLPLTADELAGFTGRYRLGLDTVVALEDEGGHLRITGEGLSGFRLFRVARDTFVCRERKGELVLGFDPVTNADRLDFHLSDDIGRLGDESRRFHPMDPGQKTALEMLLAGEAETARGHYIALLAENPASPEIQESRFNRLGYGLLRKKDTQGALAVFHLNTILYPGSGNVFDSYAEALLMSGQRDRAVANYRKSLDLAPGNENAAKILAELEGGPGSP